MFSTRGPILSAFLGATLPSREVELSVSVYLAVIRRNCVRLLALVALKLDFLHSRKQGNHLDILGVGVCHSMA